MAKGYRWGLGCLVLGLQGLAWAGVTATALVPPLSLLAWTAAGPAASDVSAPMTVRQPTPDEVHAVALDPPAPFLGVLLPNHDVVVRAPLEAEVAAVHVQLGDAVGADQALATLDLGALQPRVQAAQADADGARAAVVAARDAAARARTVHEELEAVRSALPAAEVDAARYAADAAQTSLAQARAASRAAESRRAELQSMAAGAQLRSPLTGWVAELPVSPGDRVAPGDPVLRVATAGLAVRFAIEPEDLWAVAVDDTVGVAVRATGHTLPGRVSHISPYVDPAAGVIVAQAQVRVPEADRQAILAGMRVEVLTLALEHPDAR